MRLPPRRQNLLVSARPRSTSRATVNAMKRLLSPLADVAVGCAVGAVLAGVAAVVSVWVCAEWWRSLTIAGLALSFLGACVLAWGILRYEPVLERSETTGFTGIVVRGGRGTVQKMIWAVSPRDLKIARAGVGLLLSGLAVQIVATAIR